MTDQAWVYIRSEAHLFTVGFYDPKGNWHTDSDHESSESAARRVAWLNGGCDQCGLRQSVAEALNSGDGVYRP